MRLCVPLPLLRGSARKVLGLVGLCLGAVVAVVAVCRGGRWLGVAGRRLCRRLIALGRRLVRGIGRLWGVLPVAWRVLGVGNGGCGVCGARCVVRGCCQGRRLPVFNSVGGSKGAGLWWGVRWVGHQRDLRR